MAPRHSPVLATVVVGSQHHSLGIGEPAHGERRGIISAILSLSRGVKFLARPATPFFSIGQLLLPRPAIHMGGAGPLLWRASWLSNEKSYDSVLFQPGAIPAWVTLVKGLLWGITCCHHPGEIQIWLNCQVGDSSHQFKYKPSWLGNNELLKSLFFPSQFLFPSDNFCYFM